MSSIRLPLAWSASEPQFENKTGGREIFRPLFFMDGPGLRFVLFTQGCPHHCPGCHNPESHALDGGYEVTAEKVLEEFKKNPLLKGITLSGGDPILQAGELVGICREVHAMGKDVMTYTGYTYEELMEMQETDEGIRQLLEETDTLVDGRFILAQRDLTLIYKGSRNQRIIDMNRTRAEGKLVLDPVEEENLRPEE